MKRLPLSEMTTEQLVQTFADISAAQGEAIDLFSTAKANRLYDRMVAVCDELSRRPNDGLSALVSLFSNSSAWTRYNAANKLLERMTETARPVIQAIADSGELPIAGHAGMTLSLFDGELSDLGVRRNRSVRRSE